MKIAVIGTGVAGISVLRELAIQKQHKEMEIVLFGEEETFGTGLPYQADHDVFLLNQTPETMSLFPNEPGHFMEWLKEKANDEDPEGRHVPRHVYGKYLRDMLDRLAAETNARVIQKRVEHIRLEENGQVTLAYGDETEKADAVHVCLGHLPYKDPYRLKGKRGYIHHPYPAVEKLASIPADSRIGIIGTGLTAIDLLLYLKNEKKTDSVVLTSLDGAFGSVKGKSEPIQLKIFSKERIFDEKKRRGGFIPLQTLVEWFKLEAVLQGVDAEELWEGYGEGTRIGLANDLKNLYAIGRFQSLIHQLDECLPELWQSLSLGDKQLFLSAYGRKWEKFRSPIPKQTAVKVIEMFDSGFIEKIGPASSIREEDGSFSILYSDRSVSKVEYVLNASGQVKHVHSGMEEMPLAAQLLNDQLLQEEPMGGVRVTWPECRAISPAHGILPQLIVHGQLISGIQFGNNTMGMISSSAAHSVRKMMDWLEKEGK